MQYHDAASSDKKLWVAIETHPDAAKREAAETLCGFDATCEAKARYVNGTVVACCNVLLHESNGRLVSAPAWAAHERLRGRSWQAVDLSRNK